MIVINVLQNIPNLSGGFITVEGPDKQQVPLTYAEVILSMLYQADTNPNILISWDQHARLARYDLAKKLSAAVTDNTQGVDFSAQDLATVQATVKEVPISFVVAGRLKELFNLE